MRRHYRFVKWEFFLCTFGAMFLACLVGFFAREGVEAYKDVAGFKEAGHTKVVSAEEIHLLSESGEMLGYLAWDTEEKALKIIGFEKLAPRRHVQIIQASTEVEDDRRDFRETFGNEPR